MFFFRNRAKHTTKARQCIVILDGGFAGIHAALRLEKTLARNPDIEIVHVSRENFLLFTAVLHEVATGEEFRERQEGNVDIFLPRCETF